MPAFVHQRSQSPQKSPDSTWWQAPAMGKAPPEVGLGADHASFDEICAEQVGLSGLHVATLSAFGLRPAELDPDAAPRMARALDQLSTLPECGPKRTIETEDYTVTLRSLSTESRLFYQDVDGNYYSGVTTKPLWELPLPLAPEPPKSEQSPTEGLFSLLEGAALGGFSDNNSWSSIVGQVAVGFVPVAGQLADVRDIAAGLIHLAQGKEGAALELGLSAVGVIPGGGDLVRGAGRVFLAGLPLAAGVAALKGGEALLEGAAKGGDEALSGVKGAEEAAEGVAKSGVWSHIHNPGPILPNTEIPRWFELEAGGRRFWVAPNATKHMVEYLTRSAMTHGRPVNSQTLLRSLHSSVDNLDFSAVQMDELVTSGPWELIFSLPRVPGELPCLKHAVYRP